MEETIPANSENTQQVEDPPVQESPQETQSEAPQEPVEPATQKRGRGRPAGAKDKAPRARKPRIVEQPLEPEPVPAPVVEAPAATPAPKPRVQKVQAAPPPEPPVVPEPPSPRSQQREAARLTCHLQHQKNESRRATLRDMYTKDLLSY